MVSPPKYLGQSCIKAKENPPPISVTPVDHMLPVKARRKFIVALSVKCSDTGHKFKILGGVELFW